MLARLTTWIASYATGERQQMADFLPYRVAEQAPRHPSWADVRAQMDALAIRLEK